MAENVIEPVIEEKAVEKKEETQENKSRLHRNQIIASFIGKLFSLRLKSLSEKKKNKNLLLNR